ncbi:GspL/Epsl periplasmic domain-containing protein [Bordetella bronchialis]|uniref:GspL periplasmic domain-containing protein n=1 Tax=Bordetella bronchialis TaxID=463025 RepID=A0ABN4R8U8_9BORD|nr:GspL/Epsl periplasmic domain-containing protein [Bordetella bronchialis]ANN69174.1 hypothetical protein BAU06_25280 [Bordetella bronchialis]
MKTALRLALPPLRDLSPDSMLPFALLDRDGRILRSGELPLSGLAGAVPPGRVEAILHPHDTVETRIALPPLRGPRLQAAAVALVEPLTLSPTEDLAIAYGPRDAEGQADVAWTGRAALARAWETLARAGLNVVALYPASAVMPRHPDRADRAGQALSLPADARWRQPGPAWSLALPELRPMAQGRHRWRAPLIWSATASIVWMAGLNLHAAQLAAEGQALRQSIHDRVAAAFPELPLIVDPLKQAQQRVDALRAARDVAGDGDFMPLAQAAARMLPAGGFDLSALSYENGVLSIERGDKSPPAPASRDDAARRQAGTAGLVLTATGSGWKIAPARLADRLDPGGRARLAAESRP